MDKRKLHTKSFVNEEQNVICLDYYLLIRSVEQGHIYGVAIQKTDASGRMEEEMIEGLSENITETEAFLSKLAEGMALPVELVALCDDYTFEREYA